MQRLVTDIVGILVSPPVHSACSPASLSQILEILPIKDGVKGQQLDIFIFQKTSLVGMHIGCVGFSLGFFFPLLAFFSVVKVAGVQDHV